MSYFRQLDTYEFFHRAIHGTTDLPNESRSSRKESNPDWYGTETFEQAAELAVNGWSEGRNKIERISSDLQNIIGSKLIKNEPVFDVAGSYVDVGRYVQGTPDCMGCLVQNEAQGSGKIVRVVVNASASCGVSSDVLMLRGAAICAFIEALQETGYSTEIDLVEPISRWLGSSYELAYLVNVKKSTDPLEFDRVAFMLAHPSMLRRMFFSIEEQEPPSIRSLFGFYDNGSYGTPADLLENDDRGDIYFGRCFGGDEQWSNVRSASKWVEQELLKYGAILPSTQTN